MKGVDGALVESDNQADLLVLDEVEVGLVERLVEKPLLMKILESPQICEEHR